MLVCSYIYCVSLISLIHDVWDWNIEVASGIGPTTIITTGMQNLKFSLKMLQWFEFAFIDSFFMLKAKEIHKIFKGHIILNEITVSVSDIHSVTHSTNVKTLYQCCRVSKCRQCLKLYLILFLASLPWIFEMEFIFHQCTLHSVE